MARLVYISHQVAGNIEENVKDVLRICKEAHIKGLIPIAPYLVAIRCLNDHLVEERELEIATNREHFIRRIMDEIWICGPKISGDMEEEIKLGLRYGIPIYCHSQRLESRLNELTEKFCHEFYNQL